MAKLVAVNENGRVFGENHHRSKLTDHEVSLVFALLDEGMSEKMVAEKMEISRRTVRDMKSGKTRSWTIAGWKKVAA